MEIKYSVTVTGEVHLILANGCELNAKEGIEVSEESSLTIYAQSDGGMMGKLTATGDSSDAGIGGGVGGGGSITISGGTVTATSKGKGADIGGGFDYNTSGIAPSDKIEISGGANVKGSGGDKPNLGPPHGAKTDKWASDSTGHWYPCEVESCAEQFDKDAHSPGDWIVDQAATATTPWSKHRDCATCRYRETESIPPVHSHSYGNEWKSDADRHWHECSCGDKSGEAAHSFGGWITDQAATVTTAGSRHWEWGICPYQETQTIPATGGGSSGGYIPPTYRPDVTQPSQGGSVSVSPSSPQRGDTVTVTPRPDEGYALDSITVTEGTARAWS